MKDIAYSDDSCDRVFRCVMFKDKEESLGWLFFVGLKVSFGGWWCVGNFVVCNRKIIFIWKRLLQ